LTDDSLTVCVAASRSVESTKVTDVRTWADRDD